MKGAAALRFILAILVVMASRDALADRQPHLLAIAACPPWVSFGDEESDRLARQSCGHALDSIARAATRHLDVAPERITRLLDQAATRAGVEAAFAGLRAVLGPDDRLYVYLNLHGGPSAGDYKGYPIVDETLALWTAEVPAAPYTEHGFMFVKTMRDLILAVPAGEIVIIVDSCHSGLGFDDFRFVPRSLEAAGRRVAVIFSSREGQVAHFTPDLREALFTRMLSSALEVSPTERLARAVDLAAHATRDSVRALCAAPAVGTEPPAAGLDFLTYCTQDPVVFDPHGLLDDIVVAPALRDDASAAPAAGGTVPGRLIRRHDAGPASVPR
ncbi:hypothetical protein ACFOGJ_04810 [Marinibaculum pumilum]|uniref:Caspase family protein n=1 Tax=Marinibaculum pumilum TaxID=1766165 RepID=A0ABV7KW12_9PROT